MELNQNLFGCFRGICDNVGIGLLLYESFYTRTLRLQCHFADIKNIVVFSYAVSTRHCTVDNLMSYLLMCYFTGAFCRVNLIFVVICWTVV